MVNRGNSCPIPHHYCWTKDWEQLLQLLYCLKATDFRPFLLLMTNSCDDSWICLRLESCSADVVASLILSKSQGRRHGCRWIQIRGWYLQIDSRFCPLQQQFVTNQKYCKRVWPVPEGIILGLDGEWYYKQLIFIFVLFEGRAIFKRGNDIEMVRPMSKCNV